MVPGDSHLESTAKQGNEITGRMSARVLMWVIHHVRQRPHDPLRFATPLSNFILSVLTGTLIGKETLTLLVNRLLPRGSFTLSENERIIETVYG